MVSKFVYNIGWCLVFVDIESDKVVEYVLDLWLIFYCLNVNLFIYMEIIFIVSVLSFVVYFIWSWKNKLCIDKIFYNVNFWLI